MLRRPLIAAIAAVALLACSDDEGTGPNTDLSGTYDLQSFQEGNTPALSPPAAAGTQVFTDTHYAVQITLQTPLGPQQVIDAGTYTTNGNNFSRTGTLGQATGTFTLSGNTLSTDVTAAGVRIRTTWLKQ